MAGSSAGGGWGAIRPQMALAGHVIAGLTLLAVRRGAHARQPLPHHAVPAMHVCPCATQQPTLPMCPACRWAHSAIGSPRLPLTTWPRLLPPPPHRRRRPPPRCLAPRQLLRRHCRVRPRRAGVPLRVLCPLPAGQGHCHTQGQVPRRWADRTGAYTLRIRNQVLGTYQLLGLMHQVYISIISCIPTCRGRSCPAGGGWVGWGGVVGRGASGASLGVSGCCMALCCAALPPPGIYRQVGGRMSRTGGQTAAWGCMHR